MNTTLHRIVGMWQEGVSPTLEQLISIPCKSPDFDRKWEENGYLDQAAGLLLQHAMTYPIPGLSVQVGRLPKKTPTLFITIPGTAPGNVLMYAHFDKQPEKLPWRPGLDPWKAVYEGERLYGRGAADDGYGMFAALCAIQVLVEQKQPYPSCSILVEGSEESGSPDLPAYLDHFAPLIGKPDLVIALDSGCGDYERLWVTTSLRGTVMGTLRVRNLRDAVHSGDGGGIIPSCPLIAMRLVSQIVDLTTQTVLIKEASVPIPANRGQEAEDKVQLLGKSVYTTFPLVAGATPLGKEPAELLLNQTWRPALTLIGQEGIPTLADAGNTLLTDVSLKLSLRIPPTADAQTVARAMRKQLEEHPPYGAQVTFTVEKCYSGWNARQFAPWLARSMSNSSETYFDGHGAAAMGEGAGIPFIQMLAERFPETQFMITGVLGPESNAHGPNEFLHVPTAHKITGCVAMVLKDLALMKRLPK